MLLILCHTQSRWNIILKPPNITFKKGKKSSSEIRELSFPKSPSLKKAALNPGYDNKLSKPK